jgi:hypothetical protein
MVTVVMMIMVVVVMTIMTMIKKATNTITLRKNMKRKFWWNNLDGRDADFLICDLLLPDLLIYVLGR